ncbi:putative Rho GTPase activator Rga [Talaromyces proteolyticus]|uniref:Rho GTPase activator Rga n=1 Tax=Talaromyces proteolyticus TaxID=1131652 RepID=A0AAD4PYX8_9EURO|nr:putative Rho GTPase activator Rga [Talaromyces proteolyticus]KAH8698411.1 putative Rho GTPase activator Rga [Talaromyces proteolyticus]
MESPSINPESPMDQDDVPYPCKGCGEILEEGKAFELAGNRWHIDCFRCNTCNTLLDSDAHLLLLGDGSLICSNCTYSCSSCGNKIEDLAILTGDQAFCANCFKCRNCKRRIENLRYARTSQGIFCMDCHESLMQRRRKKKTAAKKLNFQLDKSLPSLPPGLEQERAPREIEPPPSREYSASPDVSSHHRSSEQRNSTYGRVDASPGNQPEPQNQDNLILPSSAYRPSSNKRYSAISTKSEMEVGDEFLIPVAFDPTLDERPASRGDDVANEARVPSRDYFDPVRPAGSSRHVSADRQESLQQSASHIAFQEKGRQTTQSDTSNWRQDPTPQIAHSKSESKDNFKLQEAPKGRKSTSTESSKSDLNATKDGTSLSSTSSPSAATADTSKVPHISSQVASIIPTSTPTVSGRPSNEPRQLNENSSGDSGRSLPTSNTMQFLPKRGDSLEHYVSSQIQRKDVGSGKAPVYGEQKPNVAFAASEKNDEDVLSPSSQSSGLPDQSKDTFVGPNQPSRDIDRLRDGSIATVRSDMTRIEANTPPALLRYSGGGDFSMDEDLARILGAEALNQQESSESFMRRVSNSVRHGRSFSDKGHRLSKDKWPKSPVNGGTFGQDISSPSTSSPEHREDVSWLKSELRRERQRIIERDQRITELEKALNAQADVKQADSELREKRSTMVSLDTKKEVVLRELAAITEHLEKERHGSAPMDLAKLTNNVVRGFAEKLQQLKDSFSPQIEELMQQRTTLLEEVANLSRMKDKSFQEFEQLSSKNAQLAELNNQLVHQIQGIYKANSTVDASRPTNGLGIYSHSKEKSTGSVDAGRQGDLASSISTMTIQDEAEPATIVPGPQVVSIRKGQPRKFNWKRGGQTVAKGVTKGLKGAFSSERELTPDGIVQSVEGNSPMPRSQTQEPRFGFFGNQKRQAAWKTQQNGSYQGLADAASVNSESLFGVDLDQRMEVEKSIIPSIVTRCIQEVELRGMDEEGIYRKSGASTVTQNIRDGFEHANDFDISDPDLDIHAVTSALKQYFRKLPTPLITYDSYDIVLETNEATPHSGRIEALRAALETLPRVHRDVLEFLVFHLKRVVEHEKQNLMTSQNVAVVFAPTIMRPKEIAREMTDVQKKNEALKFIVENCQEIFM